MPDRVPLPKVRDGASRALDNARCWLNDAAILLDNEGQPGHIVALVLNSLEELTKAFCLSLSIIEPQRHFQVHMRDLANSSHDNKLMLGIYLCLQALVTERVINDAPEGSKTFADALNAALIEQGYFNYLTSGISNLESSTRSSVSTDVLISMVEGITRAQVIPPVKDIEDAKTLLLHLRERAVYVDWWNDVNRFTGPDDFGLPFAGEIFAVVKCALVLLGDKYIVPVIAGSKENIKRSRRSFRLAAHRRRRPAGRDVAGPHGSG